MKIKNKKDFGFGIFGILFSAWVMYYSIYILPNAKNVKDPGPRLFPLIGAVLMFVCSLIVLIKPDPVKLGEDGKPKPFLTKKQWLAAAKIFGIYCLTALLYYLIGFTATVPIIIFILTYIMSKQTYPDMPTKKRLLKALIFAVIAGALIYAAYILGLQARLPKGIIWKMLK